MMRAYEPGWKLIAMHDSAMRRGVWYRVVKDKIELCAGREGDDAFAAVPKSRALLEVLGYAEAAAEHMLDEIEKHERERRCQKNELCVYVRDHEGDCWLRAYPRARLDQVVQLERERTEQDSPNPDSATHGNRKAGR